jgi:hypothetical protein
MIYTRVCINLLLTCLRAYVLTCLRAYVLTCLRAYVLTCLRAYVYTYFISRGNIHKLLLHMKKVFL